MKVLIKQISMLRINKTKIKIRINHSYISRYRIKRIRIRINNWYKD
jgi:hypothetical protein